MLCIMIYCRTLNIVLCDIKWKSFLQKHKMESYIYLISTHIYLSNLSWLFFLLVTDLLHFREHFFSGCMSRGFSFWTLLISDGNKNPLQGNPVRTKPHKSCSTAKKQNKTKTKKKNLKQKTNKTKPQILELIEEKFEK